MFTKLITLLAVPALVAAQTQQMTQAQPAQDPSFKPITLAEALRLAKENNISNITATNSVRSSSLQIRSAKAQLYPSLNLSAGQGISAGDRVGQSGTLVPYASVWTYNTGLTLSQTLFDAGKSFADVRAAKANVAANDSSPQPSPAPRQRGHVTVRSAMWEKGMPAIPRPQENEGVGEHVRTRFHVGPKAACEIAEPLRRRTAPNEENLFLLPDRTLASEPAKENDPTVGLMSRRHPLSPTRTC